jgi:cold shock CspA family protein
MPRRNTVQIKTKRFEENQMKQHAVVCAYLPSKGFGFLSSGTGKEFKKWFFHVSQYRSGVPVVGTAVSFDVSAVQDGPCPTALDVEAEAVQQ